MRNAMQSDNASLSPARKIHEKRPRMLQDKPPMTKQEQV